MVRVQGCGTQWFRFLSYNVSSSGKVFVEVFGGLKGKEKMRYVRPDEITVPPRRRVRRVG